MVDAAWGLKEEEEEEKKKKKKVRAPPGSFWKFCK